MARYHFHILNGKNICDDAGTEIANLDMLRLEAARFAAAVLSGAFPRVLARNNMADGGQR